MKIKEKYTDNSSFNKDGTHKVETYGFMEGDYYNGDLCYSSAIAKTGNGWTGHITIHINNFNMPSLSPEKAKEEMERLVNEKLKELSTRD